MAMLGVDVSHWNGSPDWAAAQAAGVRFVIAKATEGTSWVDPKYASFKRAAESLGLAFTGYHYATPSSVRGDAVAQADNFVRASALGDSNLVPALDLEETGGLGTAQLTNWVKDYLAEVLAKTGVKPLIYTSPAFWNLKMGNSTWFADNGYRIWVAHWGVDAPRVPAQSWNGLGWTLWQFADDPALPGFSGKVDHDWYAGTSLKSMRIANNKAVSTPPATTLPGVDVSHNNGTVDWSQVRASGTKFVYAKVTQGTTFLDSQYATNKQQVEALGMAFGAYHFASPDKTAGDAVAEADWFVTNAQLTGKNLLPVLDLEDNGGLGIKKLKQWTKAWLAEVQVKLGVKAVIYTNTGFWKASMGNTTWFAANGYKLWIAHWTANPQPTLPASNWGGKSWTLWQYTDSGTVDGITGSADQDRYNGTVLAPLKIKNNR